jgi:hypothetical protein
MRDGNMSDQISPLSTPAGERGTPHRPQPPPVHQRKQPLQPRRLFHGRLQQRHATDRSREPASAGNPLVHNHAAVRARLAVIADALAKCVLLCSKDTAGAVLRAFNAEQLATAR